MRLIFFTVPLAAMRSHTGTHIHVDPIKLVTGPEERFNRSNSMHVLTPDSSVGTLDISIATIFAVLLSDDSWRCCFKKTHRSGEIWQCAVIKAVMGIVRINWIIIRDCQYVEQ